jgi:hypothetical protein
MSKREHQLSVPSIASCANLSRGKPRARTAQWPVKAGEGVTDRFGKATAAGDSCE